MKTIRSISDTMSVRRPAAPGSRRNPSGARRFSNPPCCSPPGAAAEATLAGSPCSLRGPALGQRTRKTFQHLALLCLLLSAWPRLAPAAVFNVVNVNDAGPGSLRWAISQANAAAGPDVINFNLPLAGPHTIALLNPLPAVVDTVRIDGTTSPGWAGVPIIELNGAGVAGAVANGLTIVAGGCHVHGLVINRFTGNGIRIDAESGNTTIQGNYIGTDAAGGVAMANNLNGIAIFKSPNNVIGGTTGPERNVISGNHQNGVRIEAVASSGNQVLGNLIGTDAGGMIPLGNALNGVLILDAPNNLIGDAAAGAANAIGANGASGIRIDGATATGNQVRKNIIGTDPFGMFINLGNVLHGVHIANNASANAIGGIAAGELNAIFFNGSDGIFVQSGVNNPIRHNPIGRNGNLGIDLAPNGVTLNDGCDADPGPNDLQNFPLPTAAIRHPGPGTTRVAGNLNGAPNRQYEVDFFWSPACDPSGHGEGEVYFGSVAVLTDAACNAPFNVMFPVLIPAGTVVTATATDAGGNTSEFSPCLAVITGENLNLNAAMVGPAAAVLAGAEAIFSITIDHPDEGVATGVVVSNPIPAGLTFVSASIGGDTNRTCRLENNVVVCHLGEMGNTPVTISLVLRANDLQGQEPITVTNVATVSASERDPDLSDNVAEARVQIQPLPPRRDFGDAPAPNHRTCLPMGAVHNIIPNFCLGLTVDAEANCQPDDGVDEDGVSFLDPLVPGGPARVRVFITSPGPALLNAWFDFNQDASFQNSLPERVFANAAVVPGVNILWLPGGVPWGAAPGATWARFRLSTVALGGPGGPAPDGEVEDYAVTIQAPKPFVLHAHAEARDMVLTWDAANVVLEAAASVAGPWAVVPGATSPFVTLANGPRKFYRLRGAEVGELAGMAQRADLIFEGVVTSVEYRNSDTNAEYSLSLPHTFVTFRSEQVLKGRLAGDSVTLRFLGGLAPDGSYLTTSKTTLFDVGERSILFVRQNGEKAFPLVKGRAGRFRVVGDNLLTEGGREVLWSERGSVAFGQPRPVSEVETSFIGNNLIRRTRSLLESESSEAAVSGTPVTKDHFKAFLTELIRTSHSPEELTNAPLASSANVQTPFYLPELAPRPLPVADSDGAPAQPQN